MRLSEILVAMDSYLGHIEGEKEDKEKLKDHIDKCIKYYDQIKKEKNLGPVFKRLYLSIFENKKNFNVFLNLIDDTIYGHDFGKINSKFQRLKLYNLKIEGKDLGIDSEHSILSSFLYVYQAFVEISDMDINDIEKYKFFYIIFLNAFVISRHHSDLSDFSYNSTNFIDLFLDEDEKFYQTLTYLKEDKNVKKDYFDKFDQVFEDIMEFAYDFNMDSDFVKFRENKSKEIYIYTRLIYSILTGSDFYATTDYMSGYKTSLPKLDKKELISIYNNSSLMKSIRKKEKDESYKQKIDINDLRTEIFLEAEKNLEKQKDKNIFFLEAPTGSGKSNTAMNLSYKLLDESINKIVYAYPFNTLVEQNKDTLLEFYKGSEIEDSISVINSITPIGKNKDDEFMKVWDYYIKSLLDRQFLHSPFIITSNISLFRSLFSNKRKDIFGLYQLANSVIVLDEIQAYNESLWNEIIEMLDLYAEILNLKIIIMSATLPDLTFLLDEKRKSKVGKLIENPKKIFGQDLFKNRVKLDYSLVDKGKIELVDISLHMKENIAKHKKILLEFIRKKDAESLYKIILDDEDFKDYEVLILTGDDNLKTKAQVINKLKKDKKIILIATQVIEAGVDIDMDIGYKDISKLENEEQFLGRINRSTKKDGSKAFFFDLADEKRIYKGVEDRLTLRNKDRRKDLEEKDFHNYFKLKLEKASNDKDEYSYQKFKKDLYRLNFKEISDHMKLIDEEYESVDIFLDRNLEGRDIWLEYKNLLSSHDMDYSEKIVKLSHKRLKMSDFLYKIKKRDFINYIGSYNDNIGNIYYIEDGEKYLKNNRLSYKNDDIYEDII